MKVGHFVEGLSNEVRFLSAVRQVENRGAREASWLLVKGDPGYGKSKTLARYGLRTHSMIVRAKADWTPAWMLKDIAAALGLQQSHRVNVLFEAICAELMTRGCPHLIIDEIDHAAGSRRVLETLRDITDTTECILIAGGMKGSEGALKRYTQIYSRVADIVAFNAASTDDVRRMCDTLSDVKIADDLVEHIQRATLGRLRLVMNALARVEAAGRKNRNGISLADWGNRPVLAGEQGRPQLAVVGGDHG